MGKKIEIELPDPDPPALLDLGVHPAVAEIRERLARLEERTTSEGVDPAAAEALRLASEAREFAVSAKETADRAAAGLERHVPPVVEVPPTPPMPLPHPEPEPENHEPQHPWWHPTSWL